MAATFSGSVTVNAVAPPSGTGLRVTLTMASSGIVIPYAQTDATTLGSYVDPAPDSAFTQQNHVAPYNPLFPGMRIFFRPDATGTRKEVVFEYGNPYGGQVAQNSLGYTARVYDGDDLLYTSPLIPVHYWLTRWRWQSSPRPVRKTPQQVRETHIVPNINSPPVISARRPNIAPRSYTIMGQAGMLSSMPQTGDRPDIGIVTEWQADWLCSGALTDTVIAQGEAIGSADIILRDPTTHSPINLAVGTYKNTSTVAHSSTTYHVPRFIPYAFIWDAGHHPAAAIVPFLMTGDPYYLEHMQFCANRSALQFAPTSRPALDGRYLAWQLRDMLYAEKITPVTIPGWLLPKSSFTTHIAAFRTKVLGIQAGTTNAHTVFRSTSYPLGPNDIPWYPTGLCSAPWQEAFEVAIYALAIQHGHTEWMPELEWITDGVTKRHSGTDGYYRATPTPSRLNFHYSAETTTVTTSGMTTLTLNSMSAEPWPTVPFNIKWNRQGTTVEVMTVTAKTGNVFTVTRNVSGVARASEPINTTVYTVAQISSWAEMAARQQGAYPATQYGFSGTDPTGNVHLRHQETGLQTGNVGYFSNGFAGLGMAIAQGITDAADAEVGYDWLEDEFILWSTSTWVPWRNWDIAKTLA